MSIFYNLSLQDSKFFQSIFFLAARASLDLSPPDKGLFAITNRGVYCFHKERWYSIDDIIGSKNDIVNNIFVDGDNIYAATSKGKLLKRGTISWQQLGPIFGEGNKVIALASMGDQLYVATEDKSLFTSKNGEWIQVAKGNAK